MPEPFMSPSGPVNSAPEGVGPFLTSQSKSPSGLLSKTPEIELPSPQLHELQTALLSKGSAIVIAPTWSQKVVKLLTHELT